MKLNAAQPYSSLPKIPPKKDEWDWIYCFTGMTRRKNNLKPGNLLTFSSGAQGLCDKTNVCVPSSCCSTDCIQHTFGADSFLRKPLYEIHTSLYYEIHFHAPAGEMLLSLILMVTLARAGCPGGSFDACSDACPHSPVEAYKSVRFQNGI